ncbi:unnamed protein product [Cochlearia groenlandica]
MSITRHRTNLNPNAPEFYPANFFIPTRNYFPLPPPPLPPLPSPRFLPTFAGALISLPRTRDVMIFPIPSDVSDSSLRRYLEAIWEIQLFFSSFFNETFLHNNNRHPPTRSIRNISDGCFIINEEVLIAGESRDVRTTVMINNIPNKYTNKCSMGYGFVNMTSSEAVLRLYKLFRNKHWEHFYSRKRCKVTYARIQGLESLKEHFRDSNLTGEEAEKKYMPIIFSSPRDGWSLTEALTIFEFMNKPIVEEDSSSSLSRQK